jgi:mercuric ion transport protein
MVAQMLKVLALGGTAAAVAASTCCVLPLVLGSLGLGGALVAGLGVLAPYQTAFRVAALVFLGAGFWLLYAGRPVLADGAACAPATGSGWARPVLWAGALVLAVVFSEPFWERWLA